MHLTKRLLFICLFFFQLSSAFSQNWERIIYRKNLLVANWSVETYDKGYALLNTSNGKIWLSKTDINGKTLWSKIYDTEPFYFMAGKIHNTNDNGFIISGLVQPNTENNSSGFIMKISPCGEIEWSTMMKVPPNDSYITDAIQLKDGSYMAVLYTGINYTNIVYKFSSAGKKIWSKEYLKGYDPLIKEMKQLADGSILLSGEGYFPYYPGSSNRTHYLRATALKINIDGNILFNNHLGDSTYRFAFTLSTEELSNGNLFSAGIVFNTDKSNPYNSQIILRNKKGDVLRDTFVKSDNGFSECADQIVALNDTTFVIATEMYTKDDEFARYTSIKKINLQGKVLASFRYGNGKDHILPMSLTHTFDGKFQLTGVRSFNTSGAYRYFMIKVRPDFTLDTFDNSSVLTYDSLCAKPIKSDTSFVTWEILNTSISDNLQKEGKQFSIYPNPATTKINISGNQPFSYSILDINGRVLLSGESLKNYFNVNEVPIDKLKNGMYFLKIQYAEFQEVHKIIKQ
jgi:hypothetical protein